MSLRRVALGISASSALLLAACAQGGNWALPGIAGKSAPEVTADTDAKAAAPVPAGPDGPATSQLAPRPAAAPAAASMAQPVPTDFGQRLIVRAGNLVLLVNDVAEAAHQARDLARGVQGFVVSANQREEQGQPAASLTIRVAADRFDEATDRLKGLAERVGSEQVTSRDITEEFVDLEARLRNLRATEARYLELLQQARTVEDVLKVEQQLGNIRAQIEQLQGRRDYLQRSSETSLITLELRPYAVAQTPLPDFSLLPVVRSAWSALLSTLQLLLGGVVWVAVFAPIWLPLAYLVWRWRRATTPVTPAAA